MTRIIAILILTCLLTMEGRGQSSNAWQQAYPSFPADNISSLVHWNGDTVFAFGLNWTIQRSVNAGDSWQTIAHDNAGFGIIRAEKTARSIILMPLYSHYTVDAFRDTTTRILFAFNPRTGDTTRLLVPVMYPCDIMHESFDLSANDRCIAMLQQTTVGTAVAISVDEGVHWTTRALPMKLDVWGYASLYMRDSLHGILICRDGVSNPYRPFYTDDGFRSVSLIPNVEYGASNVAMFNRFPAQWVDDSTIILVNGSTPVVSRDNARTWRSMARVNIAINSIHFTEAGDGVVAGQRLEVYKTTNWGASWIQIKESISGGQPWPFAPSLAVPRHDTFILGCIGGLIHKTNDGGITWDLPHHSELYNFTDVYFRDRFHGVAYCQDRSGANVLARSSDGGMTWAEINLVELPSGYQVYRHYVSENIIYALAAPGGMLIYKTTDGGRNWQGIYDSTNGAFRKVYWNKNLRRDVLSKGADSMYFLTDKGLLKTADGGKTLSLLSDAVLAADSGYTGLDESQPGVLWLLTTGHLLKSTDDGAHWSIASGIPGGMTPAQLQVVPGMIRVFGFNGNHTATIISTTTDEGATWDTWSIADADPTRMLLFNGSHGFSCGFYDAPSSFELRLYSVTNPRYKIDNPLLLYSTDGFRTSRIGSLFQDLSGQWLSGCFIDENNGWVCTIHSIFRTSNGGIDWVEMPSRLASGITLDPAYPNPASSSATISFTVSGARDASVQIDVYDAMGRKAANVYSGMKAPGKHSALFDASRLRAGVYFVRMTTGKEMRVEKLVVVHE